MLGTANVDSVVGLIEKLGIRISPEMDVDERLRTRSHERSNVGLHDRHELRRSLRVRRPSTRRREAIPTYDGLLLRYFVTGEESSRSLAAVAAIRREIEELGIDRIPGVEVRIGGGDVIYPLESVYYAETLARSFAYALAGNLLVLWVAGDASGRRCSRPRRSSSRRRS